MDIIECFHFLAQMEVFSPKFNKLIFSEINALPKELFDNKPDMTIIADKVSKALSSKLNIHHSQKREKQLDRNPEKTTSIFTRLPAFISTCYSLEAEVREAGAELEAGRAHAISRSHHTPLPKQVLVPMLPSKVRRMNNRYLKFVSTSFAGTADEVQAADQLPPGADPLHGQRGLCRGEPPAASLHRARPRVRQHWGHQPQCAEPADQPGVSRAQGRAPRRLVREE